MGMDRITERLREGAPPLRISEMADLIGYSIPTVRKLVRAGAVQTVTLPQTVEERIPATEAWRLMEALGMLKK